MQHNHTSASGKENIGESDLLAELAGEATQKVKTIKSEELDRQVRSQNLHDALGNIFQFFNQFTNHLNKIQPVVPRPYNLDPQAVYNDLQWSAASVDFRKQSLSDNAYIDHVSIRVKLTATRPVSVKRRWYEVENLKKELNAFGLRTFNELETLVRSNPQQEFFQAELVPDFLMRIQFQGNYDTGQIDLLCNNFDSFGTHAFTLKPEDVTQQLLDEIGRFLLGRKDDLPTLLNSTRFLPKQPIYR
jgi:hypothetical protein